MLSDSEFNKKIDAQNKRIFGYLVNILISMATTTVILKLAGII